MKSKKLRAERAKIVADARALVDTIPDGEAWPADIEAKFNEMMAAADKKKAEIDRIENLEAVEANLGERIERRAGRENTSEDEARERNRIEGDAFAHYLRRGFNGMAPEMLAVATPRFQNAQSTGTDTAGGYTVPEGFYGQIISAQLAFGGMLDAGFVFDTTSGNSLPIPTDNDTSNTGAILGENVQTSAQDVSFGAVTLGAHTYTSKLVLVSNQLLQDSAFNLDSFLSDKLGTRIARITNTHFTTGDAAAKPSGVVTGAVSGVTAASSTAVTFDEMIDLIHSVDPAYRLSARFMFADSTLKALKKLKDGEGRPIWMPGHVVKEPDTIHGYPYTINQAVAAIATTAKPILFGDFKHYFIRRVAGVQVLRLTERYADYNQTGFLAFQRWDGALVDAGTRPVKYITMA